MPYVQFKRRGIHHKGNYVTVCKDAVIHLSKECYDRYFQNHPYVLLFHDTENNFIGFKPMKKEHKDSYDIHKNSRGTNITASSFLQISDVDHSITRKYIPTWDEKENLLEIDLDKPI